ncbi:SMC2 [Auxenochlorella protothecoides x Auxenochlorella symbiontica]
MHIKEITVDGFKSYAQRVVIPGFDPQFNAITGLNGSGKSNILDSICFVLGIQNLQQVRASNLTDLVYKQGLAGVTKATVSIVFDNAAKDRSPVGYDHLDEITVTRQLVIGGRSKYLINGKVAEPSRVQNLFHSVQLNVNNPHFLIMQGRITKVLNMKPPEILGLIEEAAGTKMYEGKKQAALRTLDKKQVKLEEINRVLTEDIMPALNKLRGEKAAYMEWQHASSSLERLRHFCVAHRYVEAERSQKRGQADIDALIADMKELEAKGAALQQALKDRDDDIAGLQTEKDLQSSGEVRELTAAVDALSKRLVTETSTWKHAKESLAQEQGELARLEAALADLGEAELAARLEAAQVDAAAADATLAKCASDLAAAQAELAGAQAGDGRDASGKSMQERLADAKNAQTEAVSEAAQAATRAAHARKQLAEKRKALAAQQRGGSKLAAELAAARRAAAEAEAAVSASGYDPAAFEALQAREAAARREAERLQAARDDLASRLSAAVDFRYTPPDPRFDAARVRGVVAGLVRVSDPGDATALEVAAGGKLYQVVVDGEATAKALLARGQLRQRVTIIPLDRVAGRALPEAVVEAARREVGAAAAPALELVGYDADLSAAMRYVFGNAFVCKDVGAAKKLAFGRDTRARSVTLEGDEFNPAGTLTGGSRSKGSGVLSRLHELRAAEAELAGKRAELEAARAELAARGAARERAEAAGRAAELARHALALLEARAAGSEAAQLEAAVAALEAEVEGAAAAEAAAKERRGLLEAAAAELERGIANFGRERDALTRRAAAAVKAGKAALEGAKVGQRAAAAALAAVAAEREAAEGEREGLRAGVQTARDGVAALEAEAESAARALAASKAEYDELAGRLAACKARLHDCDKEIAAAKKARALVEEEIAELSTKMRKLLARIDADKKRMGESGDLQQRLEKEYPWIPSEREHFGRPGTDYDFAARDPEEAYAEYEAACKTLESMNKRVNKKVMAMFDKAEAEYGELKRKRDVVEGDKRKIQEVMEELDEKKRAALETTWHKVNGDFGAIFSTLLPGTSAKLEPPEGETFLQGLEVRVAFGGVWKESLSELSGGQKSLLALSLILAMLLFKPAPIYILDEVDAALDLSHTQNIGRMIKTHFPQSQFIVVSLKEGMFNNANVLFRTKFVDGVSNVSRTVNKPTEARPSKAASQRAPLRENVRV